jgi:hypothetical protein
VGFSRSTSTDRVPLGEQIAKEELESRNRLLNDNLSKVLEQHAIIERLSLQLVASDAHSYVPLPPPSLPPSVVAAEAALVTALQSEESGSDKATMRNAQALLQQYAELHSLDMQVSPPVRACVS